MHVGGEDSPKVITMPPLIFIIGLLFGWGIDHIMPSPSFIPWPYGTILGVLTIVGALALVFWAAGTFKKEGTEVDPRRPSSKIVAEGPFKYSRNPMYVGMALVVCGVAFWMDSLWILIFLVPSLFFIRYGVIAREEKYLKNKFGEEYLAYKKKVRRWI
jgi:protein-S-isoprenylcysteine O-methyltransferase Ste14